MDRYINFSKKVVGLIIISCFCMSSVQPVQAQFSEYERLAFQKNSPNIYIDVFSLPGDSENSLKLTTIFHISNNFLSFRKNRNLPDNQSFFSTSKLNIEVFKAPEKGLRPTKQVDVDGLTSVGRATWSDTAYAATYEQTQAPNQGLNGSMQVEVEPGYYTYLLQLNQDQSKHTRNSSTRNIHVPSYNKQHRNNIINVKKIDDADNPSKLTLFNMGNNITYAEDFYAFIHMPGYDESTTYSLEIDRIKTDKDDTTQINQVLKQDISASSIHQNVHPKMSSTKNEIALKLNKKEGAYTYALVKIPNKKFPNAMYRMSVKGKNNEKPIAQSTFQSYWSEIPTSLLSLDIAIDMLRFITDKNTIDKIDDGSDRARERKFREFWKEKDPTPDTEFNELQTEYYNRIDYAYDNFGSENILGFNSDRGKVYINYGPPNDTKRTFPTDDATTEVWIYNNQRFIFKATSGFGDFKLVSKNTK